MSFFLKLYSPEGFLTFSTISLLIFNSLLVYNINFKFPILNLEIFYQILTILLITFFLLSNLHFDNIKFDFFFFSSIGAQNLKLFLILLLIFFFILIWRSFIFQKLNFFEYFIILLIILLGLMFLINAYNLISIYLCLEIQALGFYILASFNRNSLFSAEAGLKYFISSSLISGIFLLGAVFIYSQLGTLNLFEIEFIFKSLSYSFNFSFFLLCFGFFLILNTLLFKLVIAPFHFWFPQIYDGAPLSSTIIFSILPKIALINLFFQFWACIPENISSLKTIFFFFGIYSMVFGVFKMLKQKKLKKLYIYSSISNIGLLLCIMTDFNLESIISTYFFLFIYFLIYFILWSTFIFVSFNLNKTLFANMPIFLNTFNNLIKQNFLLAISLCFAFFSLAAIPPLAGFLSKAYLYLILLKNFNFEISALLIYLGAFGAYYYLKFLKIIFFENTTKFLFQSFFYLKFLNIESTLFSFILFLLIFLMVEPSLLFSFCYLFFY